MSRRYQEREISHHKFLATGLGDIESPRQLTSSPTTDFESERKKERAKRRLLQCRSSSELKTVAKKKIEEAWLNEVTPLPGNMYQILIFEDPQRKYTCTNGFFARDVGFFTVWIVQAAGPPAIFLSTVFGWGIMYEDMYKWDQWCPNFQDWHHVKLTKILALFLIFGFCTNARYMVQEDHLSWQRLNKMFAYLDSHPKKTPFNGQAWLWIGALTNCWVVVWCCLDSIIVIGASLCPKDILFDALGLLFLFKLDDVGGSFGFVNKDDWPGDRLAWICKNIVEPGSTAQSQDDDDECACCECCECCNCCSTSETGCVSIIVEIVFRVTDKLALFLAIFIPMFSAMTSFSTILP